MHSRILCGLTYLAAAIWALEHAFYPLLITEGTIDVTVSRVVSTVPFLATWAALCYGGTCSAGPG